MDATQRFYDDLAAGYHLIFRDWDASITHQQRILSSLLGACGVEPPAPVLDAACGIGTQAIGLARAGYRVTGSDLSAASVARSRAEAAARAASISLVAADMRALPLRAGFDAVFCCDNALPHLLSDRALHEAVRELRRVLCDGGVLVASIRDYDALAVSRPTGTESQLVPGPEGRRIVGQGWEWDGDVISVVLYMLHEDGPGSWSATTHAMRYRALRRAELDDALRACGFAEVEWHMPDRSGYYQPIVIARAC